MKRAQRLNRAQSESAVAAIHPDGPDDVPGVPGRYHAIVILLMFRGTWHYQ